MAKGKAASSRQAKSEETVGEVLARVQECQ